MQMERHFRQEEAMLSIGEKKPVILLSEGEDLYLNIMEEKQRREKGEQLNYSKSKLFLNFLWRRSRPKISRRFIQELIIYIATNRYFKDVKGTHHLI